VKKQVHPAVALIVVLAAAVVIWYCYTKVFTGQMTGQVGTPASVAGKLPGAPPPPSKNLPGMMTGPNSPHPGSAKPASTAEPHAGEHKK
jgi:hypothetical protein